AADPLELPPEHLERLRPALRHLPPHCVRGIGRARRAGGGGGREEAPGLPHLPPDPIEEFGARRHLSKLLPSLAEGPGRHRRQVARPRPPAEEERQPPQPSIVEER